MGDGMRRTTAAGFLAAALFAGGCAGSSSTADPAGSGPRDLFVELVVVNDFSRYQDLGIQTEADTIALIGMVNAYLDRSTDFTNYRPRIVLVAQRTFKTEAENIAYQILRDEIFFPGLLANFAAYRKDNLSKNDAAILLTHKRGMEGVVSLSNTWMMCSPDMSAAVVSVNVTRAFDAASIAHALGHLLGMCHDPPATRPDGTPGCRKLAADENASTCGNGIMAATANANAPPDRFSVCSARDLDDFIDNRLGVTSCLTSPSAGVAMGAVEVVLPEP